MEHEDLEGKIVEHPKHGRGQTYSHEKLYPQLLVDIFEDDSMGSPSVNPHNMQENNWEIVGNKERKTENGDFGE